MEHQKASSAKWNMIDIRRQAYKFDKMSNMRTNRLFDINESTNSLNLIYYHQQWGSIGSMQL